MRLSRRVIGGVLLAAGLLALAPAVSMARECSADVRARLTREEIQDEVKEITFAVEVDTQETCVKVYVDFTSTERLFNGEEITTTNRGWRKVTSSSTTYRVSHRIDKESDLLDWKFTVARCVVCDTE